MHHQQGFLGSLPTVLGTYATLHLDSIGKIVNHVLAIMLVCDVFLFFSSWSVSLLPNVGFNTVLVSFLLCAQTVCVWLIVNNNRVSALSFLSPTEFMVGVALGMTIGAAVLALVLSSAYRHVSKCGREPGSSSTSLHKDDHDGTTTTMPPHHSNETHIISDYGGDLLYQYLCEQHKGAMTAVWFWSGLVFWFNFCTCLLLAMGKQELTTDIHSQYEHIGGSEHSEHHTTMADSSRIVQEYEEQFRRSQAGLPAGQMMPTAGPPAFAGDYATIPEIRTDGGGGGGAKPSSSSSQSASVAHVQQV